MVEPLELGRFISTCRKEKNLTQKQLGEELGVTDRAVSKWENGKSFPDISLIEPLCQILDISVGEFMLGKRIEPEHYQEETEKAWIASLDEPLLYKIQMIIYILEIAAVAVFFPILFTLLAFIIGLSAGCTVLIGQAWGARDHDKLKRIIGSTLFMTLIGGTLIAIFGVYFAEELLRLLGTDDEIMHMSLPFVQWMLAGSPLIFLYIIYTSIIRGVGDSVTPMIAL